MIDERIIKLDRSYCYWVYYSFFVKLNKLLTELDRTRFSVWIQVCFKFSSPKFRGEHYTQVRDIGEYLQYYLIFYLLQKFC